MLMKQHRKCFILYVILRFKEQYVCVCMGCEGIINVKYVIFSIKKYYKHKGCHSFFYYYTSNVCVI